MTSPRSKTILTTVPFKSVPGLDVPVSGVMHHGFVSLPSTATLKDAASAMRDNHVHAILITAGDGRALGWVTTRGILHNHARDWSVASSVQEAITESPASVRPSATLADAVNAFVATGASHVLVAASDDAVPVGVIADSDLVTFMAR